MPAHARPGWLIVSLPIAAAVRDVGPDVRLGALGHGRCRCRDEQRRRRRRRSPRCGRGVFRWTHVDTGRATGSSCDTGGASRSRRSRPASDLHPSTCCRRCHGCAGSAYASKP